MCVTQTLVKIYNKCLFAVSDYCVYVCLLNMHLWYFIYKKRGTFFLHIDIVLNMENSAIWPVLKNPKRAWRFWKVSDNIMYDNFQNGNVLCQYPDLLTRPVTDHFIINWSCESTDSRNYIMPIYVPAEWCLIALRHIGMSSA